MKQLAKISWKQILLWTVLGALFYWAFDSIQHDRLTQGGDNYQYLELAQNLIDGKCYATGFSGELRSTNWFPPGYAVWIALAKSAGYNDINALKWLNALASLLGFFFIASTGNLRKEKWSLVLVAGTLLAFNGEWLQWCNQIMSEMPFFFFTGLAIWSFNRMPSNDQQVWRSWAFFVSLISVAIAFHFRSIGITLLGAFLVSSLLDRNWIKAAGFAGGFGLLALPWILRNRALGLKGRYMDAVLSVNPWDADAGQLESSEAWIGKLTKNLYDTVFRGFPEVVMPGLPYPKEPTFWPWALGGAFLALMIWGLYKLSKVGRIFGIYALFSAVVFLLWHSGNQARYVWPLSPIIALGAIHGASDLMRRISEKVGAWPSATVQVWPLFFLSLLFVQRPTFDKYKNVQNAGHPVGFQHYLSAADSIRRIAPDTALIISRKPEIFHYHSKRASVSYPYTADSLRMLSYLVEKNPEFIIIESGMGFNQTPKFLVPFLNKHKRHGLWRTVYEFKQGEITSYILEFNNPTAKALLELWQKKEEETTLEKATE